MKKVLLTVALAGVASLLAVAAWYVFKPSGKSEVQRAAGKPDTVLKISLDLSEDSGKTDKQRLVLACRGDKPTPETRGRNLDIATQAARACRLLGILKPGDQKCSSISINGNSYGVARIQGRLRSKPFAAQYENNSSRDCIKQRNLWISVERLWTLSGKGDVEAGKKAKEQLEESRRRSRLLEKKHKEALRKVEEDIERMDRKNEEFVAPDAETTGDPVPAR